MDKELQDFKEYLKKQDEEIGIEHNLDNLTEEQLKEVYQSHQEYLEYCRKQGEQIAQVIIGKLTGGTLLSEGYNDNNLPLVVPLYRSAIAISIKTDFNKNRYIRIVHYGSPYFYGKDEINEKTVEITSEVEIHGGRDVPTIYENGKVMIKLEHEKEYEDVIKQLNQLNSAKLITMEIEDDQSCEILGYYVIRETDKQKFYEAIDSIKETSDNFDDFESKLQELEIRVFTTKEEQAVF